MINKKNKCQDAIDEDQCQHKDKQRTRRIRNKWKHKQETSRETTQGITSWLLIHFLLQLLFY
jgi:hypothetical protein